MADLPAAADPAADLAARVRCTLCDHEWHPASSGVLRFPLIPGRWWCSDTAACCTRRIELLARMARVLAKLWETL